MTDQMADDIRTAIHLFVGGSLRRTGRPDEYERFQLGEWDVTREDATYLVRWTSDRSLVASVDAYTVAMATAAVREKRAVRAASLN